MNDLSDDAVAPIIAVLDDLTKEQEDVHIYQGETYLFTVHKASEREVEPGVIEGSYQPSDDPGEVVKKIKKSLVPEEEYQAQLAKKVGKDTKVETESH